MGTILNTAVYDADIYLRLSKEDGDQEESDSIRNQRELILDFLKSRDDIRLHEVRVDDGYSGVNFERPSFQQMLQDIRDGKVNCVIVKDLSRFGRNHIETGKYIEKIFPCLGVRFIAINDHYDSINRGQQDNIIIPFKNLINDAYCRDISIKTRTNLEVKRKKGDFVGSFAPYGYRKSSIDKNKLEADGEAAENVKKIFRWFLQGNSAYKIAEKLNREGVLTPMDYKRDRGSGFYTGFKKNLRGEWNHVMVRRVLSNPVYIGTLVQGKNTTPNYKVSKRIRRDEGKWSRVENAHEAIISAANFRNVQEMLARDTRTSSLEDKVYVLSGVVRCGDCGAGMVRKTVPSKGKKFLYYVCGSHKGNKEVCSPHSIRVDILEKTVLELINLQIQCIADLDAVLREMDEEKLKKRAGEKQDERIKRKKEEIQKYYKLKMDLYEDYKEELITREEYLELKEFYEQKVQFLEQSLRSLSDEALRMEENSRESNAWMDEFLRCGHLDCLSRETVISLIDRILVYEKKQGDRYPRIEVVFRYEEEMRLFTEYKLTSEIDRQLGKKEADGAAEEEDSIYGKKEQKK